MPSFKIEIIETLARVVEVEAETDEEAYNMVEKAYRNAEIVLTDDDYIGYDIQHFD